MSDIRFVQVCHLHPVTHCTPPSFDFTSRRTHLRQDRVAQTAETERLVAEGLGVEDISAEIRRAFSVVNGSMIHDI